MKLFYKPGASSLTVHIALREAGLDFTIEKVDLASQKTEHGQDYRVINPKGQVPALLLDDGTVLTEVVAIVQYLADLVPDRHLIPAAGTLSRYQAMEWLNYVGSEMHKSLGPLLEPATPEDYKVQLREQMETKLRYLDRELADGDYLLGTRFTVADAYLFTMLTWAYALKFDLPATPAVARYLKRVAARPTVDAALAAEGLK
ncbi:glutathione transferase GstA [Acerihabitans arboris]|uniref:Glutathione transferase GstA n=1 Tax=Acerihabitans arboris TaxID=2691583 RepID=A0A845SPJ9_9GAMM|nr:glutathione transferase GstA [Acerihabitans arboris]NDL63105.1 glutathione transferase GstA [Acerihabitans arboris]